MTCAISLLLVSGWLHAASVGEPAPAFELQDQYGESHGLEDFRGQWLVVFFYPRADTPGCTTEACNFRDNIYAIRGAGAEVLGISVDSVDDQRAFSDKYKLPFTLLSDADGATCDAYGVLRNLGVVEIARRESFLIDPNGVVVKHYERVDPASHTQQVIADLKQLTRQTG
ncbi:MAG: peroxiredoxin [Gammaproteobacteria bacterium HGW-Gammaproteobacteria-8]|nr:MAG: peroxiredoxin [Gammaproteobacteria bacterium HGW-Gammaproteobacteria-8]